MAPPAHHFPSGFSPLSQAIITVGGLRKNEGRRIGRSLAPRGQVVPVVAPPVSHAARGHTRPCPRLRLCRPVCDDCLVPVSPSEALCCPYSACALPASPARRALSKPYDSTIDKVHAAPSMAGTREEIARGLHSRATAFSTAGTRASTEVRSAGGGPRRRRPPPGLMSTR